MLPSALALANAFGVQDFLDQPNETKGNEENKTYLDVFTEGNKENEGRYSLLKNLRLLCYLLLNLFSIRRFYRRKKRERSRPESFKITLCVLRYLLCKIFQRIRQKETKRTKQMLFVKESSFTLLSSVENSRIKKTAKGQALSSLGCLLFRICELASSAGGAEKPTLPRAPGLHPPMCSARAQRSLSGRCSLHRN